MIFLMAEIYAEDFEIQEGREGGEDYEGELF